MPDPSTDNSGSSSPPDLLASTGVNDASSPWNGLLQSALSVGSNAATTAIDQALGAQTPIKGVSNGNGGPANPSSPSVLPGMTKSYLPWIIGAVVVAAIVWFIARE